MPGSLAEGRAVFNTPVASAISWKLTENAADVFAVYIFPPTPYHPDGMNENTIPMMPQDWNASDPSASLRAFAEYIHKQARQIFLQDKSHAEILFFLPIDGKGHIVHSRFEDRDKMAAWMKAHIAEHYAFGVIHICECWVRFAEGKNDHILRQILDGEMKVSQLREEHRKEALSVTVQARDGYSMTWIDEIVRDKATGNVSLKPSVTVQDFEGRVGKLFG